jgi:hypothetical protein
VRGQIKRTAGLLIQNLYTTLNKPGYFTQTPGFGLSPIIVLAGVEQMLKEARRNDEQGSCNLQLMF